MRGNTAPYAAVGGYPLPLGFNGNLAWIWRWFSGRPMNGHRYTDATGYRYGTMSLDVSGHATTFQLLPGYKRFLYGRLPLMLAAPFVVLAVLSPVRAGLVAAGMATWAAYKLDGYRRTVHFRKEVTEPLGAGVAALLKVRKPAGLAHTWVTVPETFRDDDQAKIVIRLPLDWLADPGDKTRMTTLVSSRLNLEEVNAVWTLHGAAPYVTYVQAPKPPKRVSFEQGVAMAEDMSPDELAMGLGPRDKIETFDLGLESPHLMVAGGSGAGKSELIAYLAGQWMRRGGGLAILDAKFTSHMWARRVPGILYASEAEAMHEALVWLDAELMDRARRVSMDPAVADTLVPLLIVLEEMNAASGRLRAYWKSVKTTEDPMMSPALTALTNIASMGREMRIHIILAGQSVTAKVTGGPEARENFGGRALARATAKQWAMLAPQIKPAPVKRQAPGRWHLVVGDLLKEFQVPFVDLKERETPDAVARFLAWATGGPHEIPDVPAMMAGAAATTQMRENTRSEPVAAPAGMGLRAYATARSVSYQSLVDWRNRRPDFPVEVGEGANRTKLYDPSHLDAFVASRLREPASVDD